MNKRQGCRWGSLTFMQVVYTRRALRDLSTIHTYIAADNPALASRMAVELVAACDRLE